MNANKLTPYGFDLARYLSLLARPNFTFRQFSLPDDSAFPDSGLIQLRGAVDPALCRGAIASYDDFEALRDAKGCAVRDEKGRNYRVTNLHIGSRQYLDIGTTSIFHEHVTRFLRRQSCVHTSLAYKHGSQQLPHIDTPFFWTRPMNLYAGVWVALEDVHPDAGPLFYYAGSHKYFNTREELADAWKLAGHDTDRLFALIHNHIKSKCERIQETISAGDAVIWHPGVMHGGDMANDPKRTRYSVVFHFGAVGVNISDDSKFPGDFPNLPRSGVLKHQGQYYLRKAKPAVMLHKTV